MSRNRPLPSNRVVIAQLATHSTRNGSAREAASSKILICWIGALMNWKLVRISFITRTTRNRIRKVWAAARVPFFSWIRSQNPSKGWVITCREYRSESRYRDHDSFRFSALSAFVFHFSPEVTYCFLKADQLLKCILNGITVNRFRWVKILTRGEQLEEIIKTNPAVEKLRVAFELELA